MTYGDKIRSMNDKELAEFISQCVIDDNEGEAMYIYGIGHFVWAEDLADKLGEEIKEDELPPVTATPSIVSTHDTCEFCRHFHMDEDGHGYHCEKPDYTKFPVYADFHCIDFEKRDNEKSSN